MDLEPTRLLTTFLQSYKNQKALLFNSKWTSWVQFEDGHEKWEPLNILCNKVRYSLSSQGHPCSFQQNNAEARRVSATTPQHCVETVWEVPSPACVPLRMWHAGIHTQTSGFHTVTQLYVLPHSPAINVQLHPGWAILHRKKAEVGSNGAECRFGKKKPKRLDGWTAEIKSEPC